MSKSINEIVSVTLRRFELADGIILLVVGILPRMRNHLILLIGLRGIRYCVPIFREAK